MILIHHNPLDRGHLIRKIGKKIPELGINDFPTLDALLEYLEHPLVFSDHLALISLSGAVELEQLIAKRHLMGDIQSILILPAQVDSETLQRAHELRPRVVFSGTANWKVLHHILIRMVQRHGLAGKCNQVEVDAVPARPGPPIINHNYN